MGWITRDQEETFFFSTLCPEQLPTQLEQEALSPGVKQLRHEIDHLHLMLRLRMCEAIPPIPPHIFMAWYSNTGVILPVPLLVVKI
jgi:hypothetical protein